ncbi:hypothetical protein L204_103182 [Cryptococcus depauperatus]
MASVKRCPFCGPHGDLETDQSAGNVVCQRCGSIVEEGILVSEIGFAESAGGRVHVQGTFVSNYSTGVSGTRGGRGEQQSIENIKAQGASRIEQISQAMHLSSVISRGAIRFFSLAVDNKFNRGRKKEYILASCLYLQCRLKKDAHMLIDFSEFCGCNVFELGATYLKLRATLNLLDPMPEVDPAIYNIRFAHRLSFGSLVTTIAADASRLVRRFRADWMTQGRRPAGVCGACLIIAGRMSNFLRTPEEVAQVVKVHPNTIKRRLLEFAETEMAKKTISEWRLLSDDQLEQSNEGEKPPVMKEKHRKQEKEARRRQFMTSEIDDNDNEDDEDESVEESDTGDGVTRKKYRMEGGKARDSVPDTIVSVLEAAAHDFEDSGVGNVLEEDDNLEPLAPADFVSQLESARDDPEQAREERRRAKAALMQELKGLRQANEETDDDNYDGGNSNDDLENLERLAYDVEKEDDEIDSSLEPTQLAIISQADASLKPTLETFDNWHDETAVIAFFEEKFFGGEKLLYQDKMAERIRMWWAGRDPKKVYMEMEVVKKARWLREKHAKLDEQDQDLGDIDDEELEELYTLDEDAKQARARMWLSANGMWLEAEKEKQELQEATNRARCTDLSKPRKKRKRATPYKGPHQSASQAITHFASTKTMSKRVNFNVLRGLGNLAGIENLIAMEDEDEKEEGEEYAAEEKGEENYDTWQY